MDDRRRRRGQMQFTPGAKAPGALSFWGEKSAFEKIFRKLPKKQEFCGYEVYI